MNFVIRFALLSIFSILLIALAPDKWVNYSTLLMVVFFVVAGLIFMV